MSNTTAPLQLALLLGLASPLLADLRTRNSATPAENAAAEAAWLADIGISARQVAHRVDFEFGFTVNQNVSGVPGLFPGGLVIVDSSSAASATVQSSTTWFGGSTPIGTFALSHNEAQWLELDFGAQPVDYVALQDIDQAGSVIRVHHLDGAVSQFTIESTGSGAGTAEFVGIFRNDRAPITRVQIDASGDGRWGIDNLQYGPTIGNAYCVANANSTGAPGVLDASGSPVAAAGSVQLVAWGLPANQFGYFLASPSQGFVPGPGGSQGNLCLAGPIGRYVGPGQVQNSGGAGTIALALDLAETPTPAGPTAILAGQTWNFQCWFRDANPTSTSNFTSALSLTFL